jgi:ribosome-associated protein
MEDMLPEIKEQKKDGLANSHSKLLSELLSELLKEHKGQNVSVLDLHSFNAWTDYFIIATVSSNTHMDGLERHIKVFCRERDMEILGSSRKSHDEQWRLIDLGGIVIHLMTSVAREFYELDRLWASGK